MSPCFAPGDAMVILSSRVELDGAAADRRVAGRRDGDRFGIEGDRAVWRVEGDVLRSGDGDGVCLRVDRYRVVPGHVDDGDGLLSRLVVEHDGVTGSGEHHSLLRRIGPR